MGNVKLGIIGIGNMGGAHLSCVRNGEIENLAAVAVCDINAEKLSTAKSRYADLVLFSNWKELVDSGTVDAVLIATPHCLHAEIACYALEKGLHVLSEKPVDCAYSAALRVNKAAKKSDKVFSIMFNQRTNSHFIKAKKLVSGGELGELKSVRWVITNWFRTQAYYDSGSWRGTWKGEGGGVLMNQAPHNLDLLQWICGMPSAVTAFCGIGKHHEIGVEDEATIVMDYPNGATGLFVISTGEYPGSNRLEINLSKGRIVIEGGKLMLWRLEKDSTEILTESESGFEEIPFEYSEITEYSETAHKGILKNFVDAILYGEKLIAPGVEGINQLSIANAAYLSQSRANSRIDLPIDADEYDTFLSVMRSSEKDRQVENAEKLGEGYNKRWQVRF